MNELTMMEWLVVAIIFAAGIHGCVTSGRKTEAATTAPINAVSTKDQGDLS
jgi:hypothetical protein